MYEHENKNYIHWAHLDDTNEVALVATKSADASANANVVSGPSQPVADEDRMLNLALQMSIDSSNNVNAEDMDDGLQKVLQQSMIPAEQTMDDQLRQALAMSMDQDQNQNSDILSASLLSQNNVK